MITVCILARVGIFKDDQFILISSDEGRVTTPNYITLIDQGPITGLKAKEQADRNTENTIYEFRSANLPPASSNNQFIFPTGASKAANSLTLLCNKKSACSPTKPSRRTAGSLFKYRKIARRNSSPEELTADILKRMKTAAEHWASNKVTNAVITVPTYLNDAQQQATKDASAIAGLNVLRLMDEPRAAGLAYELDKVKNLERNDRVWKEPIKEGLLGNGQFEAPTTNCLGVDDEYCYLVFNIEERSCDLTITSVDYGVFELLGNLTGDFGTQDFDHDLFKYLSNIAREGIAQLDISEDFERIDRFNLEIKKAQETLLTSSSAEIISLSYNGEKILSTIVTREKIQELHAKRSVGKVRGSVEKVLLNAKLGKRAIDGLIVTRDPVYAAKIQPILQGYFEGAKLHSDIESNEVVVRGSARMAGILSGENLGGWDDYYPIDLLPLSVGIETAGGSTQRLF